MRESPKQTFRAFRVNLRIKGVPGTQGIEKIAAMVLCTILGGGAALLGCKLIVTPEGGMAIPSFQYIIDPNNPGNQA